MKYGLVLAGGGVRGACQMGVWRALCELGIKISAISGTSIGALNGALLAQGEYKTALRLWQEISAEDIVSLPDGMNGENNLFRIKNIPEIIREIHKNDGLDMSPLEELLKTIIDEDKLRKSPVDFGVAAFSVTQKKGICKFKNDIPKGEIIEYLMASACLIGFKKKMIGAEKIIDGGMSNNMPVNMMLEKDIDNIITVDVKGIGIYRNFNLAGRNVINICCEDPQTGIMDFEREGILRNIDVGYISCMRAFGRLEGHIYSFKTENYRKARRIYSEELICGIENAARIFGIDTLKIYKVDELINLTMQAYYAQEGPDIKESIFDRVRQMDSRTVVVWLVKVLESGKSDFLMEKLSVLGANYDAASAIMYFKN